MTLKFDLKEREGGYSLCVTTEDTEVIVDASEAELKRLLIDLAYTFTPGKKDNIPEIVCLCGSTKFKQYFIEEYIRLAGERGKTVLTVGFFGHTDGWPDDAPHGSEVKEQLDEGHKRKIDLADRVHVINVGGYVGESTLEEIKYASEKGKIITWYDDESAKHNVEEAL